LAGLGHDLQAAADESGPLTHDELLGVLLQSLVQTPSSSTRRSQLVDDAAQAMERRWSFGPWSTEYRPGSGALRRSWQHTIRSQAGDERRIRGAQQRLRRPGQAGDTILGAPGGGATGFIRHHHETRAEVGRQLSDRSGMLIRHGSDGLGGHASHRVSAG